MQSKSYYNVLFFEMEVKRGTAGHLIHLLFLLPKYHALLVVKVVWLLAPSLSLSRRHRHLDNGAARMVAQPKRKRMKKSSKIESVNIRRHHLGLTGIVYSEGYPYAVRFAPNTAITESSIRKLWKESRRSFHPYNDTTDEIIYHRIGR